MNTVSRTLLALSVLLTAACGGGGGGGDVTLTLTPNTAGFVILQGDGASKNTSVQLSWTSPSVAGFGLTTPTGGALPDWLVISAQGGGSPLTLTIERLPNGGQAPGVRAATLRILAGDSRGNVIGHVDLVVNDDVVALPTVGEVPVISTVESEVPAPATLTQSHDNRITFVGASTEATWVDESGQGTITLTLNEEVADLAVGAHCTNVVLAYQFAGQPFSVPRGLCIAVEPALSGPEGFALAVDAATESPQLAGFAGTIVTATASQQPLTITSSQPWLVVEDPTVMTGTADNLALHVDAAQLASLPNGPHTATLTVAAPDVTPLEIPFEMSVDLPFVHTVAPLAYSGLFAGEEIIVRGKGFQHPDATLALDGAPVPGAQLVNDTELRFPLGAQAAGTHPVTIDNKLGIARPSANLRVVDAPYYATYSTPLQANAVRVRVSPVNGSVYSTVCYFCYAGDGSSSIIRRFTYDAGLQTWSSTQLGVPDLYDIALTLDESQLIVLTTHQLRFLDPVTLVLQKTVPLPASISSSAMQLAVMNDGNIIIEALHKAYSLALNAFVPMPAINEDTGITASADGARALFGRLTNEGNAPFKWYNASTGAVTTTSTFQYFDPLGSLSRRGDRGLFGNLVLDGTFSVEATIPSYSGVVNPTGTRAYSVDFATWTIRVFDLTTFPFTELAPLPLGGDVGVTRLGMDPRGTALFALAEDKFFVFDLR